MSEDEERLRKERELFGVEGKTIFEYMKHTSTMCTATLVILGAVVQRLEGVEYPFLLGAAAVSLLFALWSSVLCMFNVTFAVTHENPLDKALHALIRRLFGLSKESIDRLDRYITVGATSSYLVASQVLFMLGILLITAYIIANLGTS